MQSVTTERHDDVLVVLVNNPPVNALSRHVRQGLHLLDVQRLHPTRTGRSKPSPPSCLSATATTA